MKMMKIFKRLLLLTAVVFLIDTADVNAETFVTPLGNVTQEDVTTINKVYDELPQGIRDLLYENGYGLVITNADLNTMYGGEPYSWYGCCDDETHMIYVRSGYTENFYRQILFHEVGHAINNILGKYSNTDFWKSLYAAENMQLHATLVFNSSEWFAECVCLYYENPAVLKMVAPNSYNAVDMLINTLTGTYDEGMIL